ncbi:3-keto-disaccharide hydrolase [Pontibacter beigongshangensis]|uniref:3-keto-disaccharide hydrolase n=1 Tax=Pontibacter beigongshangensis TaxID=2574733 RepID=UPI0016502E2A|nr:DUF1080 domain-containing protein [Pontibacter beigongshangensis]
MMNYKSCLCAAILATTVAAGSLTGCSQKVEQATSSDWTSLFDGKSLDGWKRVAGEAPYEVEDGAIVGTTIANTPNTFLVTEKEYDDFILELEAMMDSNESNSGIQTRSHYDPEANNGKGRVYGRQVEFDPSERAWSGGIYDEARRGWQYPLSLNPQAQQAFKVGEYNKIRIECIGNETKTWINEVPVAYVVDTIDSSGFIGLQVHSVGSAEQAGKKVYFKNIRIKTTDLTPTPFPEGVHVVNNVPNSLTRYEQEQGWKLLFDGKSSDGWVGAHKSTFPERGWKVENGALTVLPSGGGESTNGGDIVTKEKYSAFDLSFEYKLSPGANSGVKYSVTLNEQSTGSAIGLEYQVLDDEKHPDAKMGRDGNRTLASLYDLITADKPKRFLRPIGEWNKGRVVVHPDNKVEHYLNGIKVLEYVRGSEEFRNLVANSKYKTWENFGEAAEGHILLQDHGDLVSFRSIKIKAL